MLCPRKPAVTALLTLALASLCAASPDDPVTTASAATIRLPVEVIGPDGFECSVTAPVQNLGRGAHTMLLTLHGLHNATQAQVQLNGGLWIPLTNQSATSSGLAQHLGGIGSALATLQLSVRLPAGALMAGDNRVRFRFNATDGANSGYRVLSFNFLDAAGQRLIANQAFFDDDPAAWSPPLLSGVESAQGKLLWTSAPLVTPVRGAAARSGMTKPILAHCGDCHASDGADLQYFNYSNQSIVARSQFHGLTQFQGRQIASYIRSLTGPRPGRPWNPVYQPGPGLDAQPAADWPAGAGIGALVTDQQSLAAVAAQNGQLNIRETPIAIPLPDWNQWLPRVHPADAYGAAAFARDLEYTQYVKIRALLSSGASFFSTRYEFEPWGQSALMTAAKAQTNWTPASAENTYSLALWRMVKQWELAHAFGTDALERTMYGPRAEPRGWFSNPSFMTSPNMLHIPKGGVLRGWSDASLEYTNMSWYQLQVILNGGNGRQEGPSPVDWPYVSGVVKDLNWASGLPQSALELELLTYGLQMAALQTQGPEAGQFGWLPDMSDPSRLVHPAWEGNWAATPPTERTAITEAHVRRWFAKVQTFTRAQWIQGGFVNPVGTVQPNNPDGAMGDRMYYMLPRLSLLGVDSTLIGQIAAWAKTIWPAASWQTARWPQIR